MKMAASDILRGDIFTTFKLHYGEDFVKFLVLAMQSSGLSYPPKLEQVDALFHVMKGKDALVNLPTGFGKSWIYTILPFICDQFRQTNTSKIVVVSPLISLMEDQICKLKSHGIEVVKVTDILGKKDITHIKIIMLSPEAFEIPDVKDLLKRMRDDIVTVAVDEAHCIEQWGRTFRAAYDNLRELRSLLLPGLPLVALTATASQSASNYIISKLDMEGCHIVKVSVNKENIFHEVKALPKFNPSDLDSRHSMFQEVFSKVVENLKTFKESAHKIIIFCFTTNDCADVFEFIQSELGEDGIHVNGELLVNMYMKVTDAASKSKIVEEFTKTDGILRVVIATSAFGMGVDCPNVSQVIHFKSPGTLIEYVQGSGRAGCDGSAAKSTLYYSTREFSTRKSKLTKSKASKRDFAELQSVQSFCNNTDTCRRQLIISHFDGKSEALSQCQHVNKHNCCDICVTSCKCEVCMTEQQLVECSIAAEVRANLSTQDPVKVRSLTQCQKGELKKKLLEYRLFLRPDGGSLFNVNLTTGLTREVIEQAVDNSETVKTADDIMEVANVWDREQAVHILHIIETLSE